MAIRLQGLSRWRSRPPVVAAGALIVLVLVVGFVSLKRQAAGHVGAGGEQSAVMAPHPFAATLGVVGAVTAGDAVQVAAPFEGVVKSVEFEYGAPVVEGQGLVTLDTGNLEQRRDEAMAAVLKASQTAQDLASWASGPEVSQARRGATAAASELGETRRKLQETKALLDRGLVARDEYDGLVQQQRGQDMALTAARQDLAATLRRGQGADRRVAEIELKSDRARLADLAAEVAGAVVRAPIAGVIVRPAADKPDAAAGVHAGLQLAKGQLIGAIARPGGLGVSFQLSEADANRVRPGQKVTVTGPGFPGLTLGGTIASVAREANPPSAGGGPTVSFAAAARLDDLSAAQGAVIRIGMTANVTVDLYRNPAALVTPPAAIQGEAPDVFVMVKDPRGGRPRRVPVRIGHVAPDGVEILSGLKAGDVVVWSASAPAAGNTDDPS